MQCMTYLRVISLYYQLRYEPWVGPPPHCSVEGQKKSLNSP